MLIDILCIRKTPKRLVSETKLNCIHAQRVKRTEILHGLRDTRIN